MSGSRGTHKPDAATARLAGWIGPVVDGAGYDLEDVVITPAGRRSVVRVVVDRDQGVTLDDIAEVSKAVSEVLDAHDDGMGRPYVLEVTSPGVERPLNDPRHWRRNVGRLVTVTVSHGGNADEVTGRVTAVDDAGVTLAVEAKGKPGAKKRPPTSLPVTWAHLGAGRVQVEFGRAEADTAEDHAVEDEAADDGTAEGATAEVLEDDSSHVRGGGQ